MSGKLLSCGWRLLIIVVLVYHCLFFAGETTAGKDTLVENGAVSEKEEVTSGEGDSLFEMSIEQLMEIEVGSSATLTQSKPRLVPAAVTTITKEQIQASGTRSLNELLEIYVPNLQIVLHLWEPQHLGLRGSISDRDDKYLLLVNGRVMNERLHYGALSERDLPLLRDIHHIEVIRGPGSVLYGPGHCLW
jgi:outer membrane receptor for Fe3+-dicitrate